MKYIVLSIIASTSLTCFGAADECIRDIIKVTKPENCLLQHQVAVGPIQGSKVIACLVAGTNLREEAADELLQKLLPLKLSAWPNRQPQYAKIKEIANNSNERSVVFVIERDWLNHQTFLYMRILNETTTHRCPTIANAKYYNASELLQSLYCKLSSTGPGVISYEESDMSEEIFNKAEGLTPSELGFVVDLNTIHKTIPVRSGCSIL